MADTLAFIIEADHLRKENAALKAAVARLHESLEKIAYASTCQWSVRLANSALAPAKKDGE